MVELKQLAMKRRLARLLLGAAIIAVIVWLSTREAALLKKITTAQRQLEHPTDSSDLMRDPSAQARVAPLVPAVKREDPAEMIRIEDLRNRGRATPSDAFQTLIWAAFTGNDDEVSSSIVLAGGDRELAQAWRAALPVEDQSKYPTVESIPGILVSREILRRVTAVQIGDAIQSTPDGVQLSVRILQVDGTDLYLDAKMRYGNRGWGWEIPSRFLSSWRNRPPEDIDKKEL